MKTHTSTLFVLSVLVLVLSGCPNPTGTTRGTTASTSGLSGYTDDGLIKPDHRITLFVHENFDNLSQDMAQGQGEYLASLGDLLDVPEGQRAEFYASTQKRYQELFHSQQPKPDQLLAALR
jgi:hypothetical protein